MSSRPNPKYLTNEQRIASISEKLRRQLIRENAGGKGVGMKTLAQLYKIPEKTVREIIRDSRPSATKTNPSAKITDHSDLWERPDIWTRYGIKGPCTPRMVPAT